MLTYKDALIIAFGNVIASALITCIRLIIFNNLKVIHINGEYDDEEEEDE